MAKRRSEPSKSPRRPEDIALGDVVVADVVLHYAGHGAGEVLLAAHELGALTGTAEWTDREQRTDEILDHLAAAPIEGPADRGARDALSWLIAGEAVAALTEHANLERSDLADRLSVSDESEGEPERAWALGSVSGRLVRRRIIAVAGLVAMTTLLLSAVSQRGDTEQRVTGHGAITTYWR